MKLAAKKNNKSKFNKSDFARRFLRNRSRFGTNKNNKITEKTKPSDSAETTTTEPTESQQHLGGLFPGSSTTEKSRLSFADLFAETETSVKPDGRKPRVKSNIKQRLADNGRPFAESHKIPVPSDLFEPKGTSLHDCKL